MLLPNASVESLTDACASGSFTHVHLLAHGVQYEKGDDHRFGIALHKAGSPTGVDVVDGERLACALRTHVEQGGGELSRPTVVTLASCDAGNVGSVVAAGASIAHELHLGGIPLVVASQFPLSITGSIHMVQTLYDGLLWGKDPRLVIDDLRRTLKVQVPKTHDWASIVAYATFPDDLEKQLSRVRIEQADRSMNAALNHADRATSYMSKWYVKKWTALKKTLARISGANWHRAGSPP